MNFSRFVYLRLQGAPLDTKLYGDVFDKGSSPPPAPDDAAAAREQGAANLEAAIATGILNRPNESTPFGTRRWNVTGYTPVGGQQVPNYQSSIEFTPEGKALFDKNLALQKGMMDLGGTSLGGLTTALSKPFDISSNRDALVDTMYKRATRLMDPEYALQEDKLRSDLVSRGFSLGDKGYTDAFDRFERNKQQAYADARDRATTSGAQQAIQEAMLQRTQPLQEVNALRTGAMPNMPQFQNFATNSNVAAAPMFAAAQAQGNQAMQQYGIDVGSQSNMLSGLAQLGGAYFMGGGSFPNPFSIS